MNPRARNVGVLGGGSWGTSIAHMLGSNGHRVLLWLRDESTRESINTRHVNDRYLPDHPISERVEATDDLAEIGERCYVIFCVIPSHAMRGVAAELGRYVKGDQVLIHATKGIEADVDRHVYRRMSEVLREETCARKIGVLSGPNLAKEIMAGQPAATVVASKFPEAIKVTQELLVSPTLRVYGNHDVVGVEVGGALKNIIALASGFVNGLGLGDNTKAMLLTRGLAEITRMGVALGADPLTFSGLSGIGDLMCTCASPLSRNYQVGARLARGEALEDILESMGQVAEGVKTTRAAKGLADNLGVVMPITEAIYRILYENLPVSDAMRALMTRDPRSEVEYRGR
ncbi:MAG: NAD(P)-dependent glycerol-3-phosphate dehydrogenase [Myxococcales bacterium]|nr:NAD(P)-dependent glycerol-3-phosphate dehydrogenase [Myxococcales bacterium]